MKTKKILSLLAVVGLVANMGYATLTMAQTGTQEITCAGAVNEIGNPAGDFAMDSKETSTVDIHSQVDGGFITGLSFNFCHGDAGARHTVKVSATTFTEPTTLKTIPITGFTITPVDATCIDAGCDPSTITALAGGLFTAPGAPGEVELYDSVVAATSGTWTGTQSGDLLIPANTAPGVYESTFTYSMEAFD
jgi:hypothetical protein